MKTACDDLVLGIDGGASKTDGVIINGRGDILAQRRAPGSAIIGKPQPHSCRELTVLVDQLRREVGCRSADIRHCGIGLNGVDFEDEFAVQHANIARALQLEPARVTLVNDGIAALWGATSAARAMIVQAGSGLTSAYRCALGNERLFDPLNVAGIYDMRIELVHMVSRMIHGMIPTTPLKEKVLAFFDIADEEKFDAAIYRGRIPQARRNQTVPLLFESWLEGDAAADFLVTQALEDYALLIRTILVKIGGGAPDLRLGGGVLSRAPQLFWERLTASLQQYQPAITPQRPMLSAALGAAFMAAHQVGYDISSLFQTIYAQCGSSATLTHDEMDR